MDKKEARIILGVSKEISRNDLERKYSILMKKHRMIKEKPKDEDTEDTGVTQDINVANDAGVTLNTENAQSPVDKQEEYSFEQVTQAYNILMGYEIPMKEEPPSKAAPLFKKAGIDEKKARNFLYYYKNHIIIIIIAVISIVFIVKGCVERVDPDFTTAFIGKINYTETDKLRDVIKANIPEIKEPGFDGAFITEDDQSQQQYAMVMKATVLFAAGDVDIFILDKASFTQYAKNGAFMSLDEIAPKLGVDMEKNKEYIVKIEDYQDVSEAESMDKTAEEPVEEPVEEHLYGIDISQSTALKDVGVFGSEMIATIYINCKQQDKAVKLLQFLKK